MTKQFHETRRQQFLHEAYFIALSQHWASSRGFWSTHQPEADSPAQAQALAAADVADDSYMLLSLRYTAGIPLEALRDELTGVVVAYEQYQKALAAYEEIPEIAPLGMGQLDDYERCMQLIGLCYLLHRRDLMPRIAALQDPGYRGEDALYEDLLCFEIEGRVDTDVMLHLEVYDPLLGSMYADSNEEAVALIQEYVDNWYPAFKYAPWHDGHRRIDGTDGDYFGYWAFEAGAVAYLCEIDDSAISHMVYPKDLVEFARSFEKDIAPKLGERRCEGGRPCPQSGIWWTPAKADSRQAFEKGAMMPNFPASGWGATIWYREVE